MAEIVDGMLGGVPLDVRPKKKLSQSPARAVAPDQKPRFFYVNVVWGADYVDLFTKYSIPTLLAPGNIAGLPNRDVSEFLIITTEDDADRIRASAIFPRLSDLIKVVFLTIEVTPEHKYDQMKRGHAMAVEYAARRGFCIFLSPDAIVSDGMMKRLYDLALQGRRVVAGVGPRANQESFLSEFQGLPEYRDGEPIAIRPRRLVSLMMRHLHQDILKHFADSPVFPEKPYACIWSGPGEGMLVRSLNLHPYLFDTRLIPEGEVFDWRTLTIDWSVIPRFVTDWNDFYVEKDSDGFCILGTTPSHVRDKPEKPNRLTAETLSLWLLSHKYELINRVSFLYPIVFHEGPLNAQWDEVIRKSGEFSLEVVDPARALRHFTLLGRKLYLSSARAGGAPASEAEGLGTAGSGEGTFAPARGEGIEMSTSVTVREPIPFFYAFSVWGDRYVDYLCQIGLPSLLAPRSLPILPNNSVSSVVIATTPQDAERIRSTEIFRALEQKIKVEFPELPSMGSGYPSASDHVGKYTLLTHGHTLAAERAMGRGCAIFLGPDAIYSDGMFSRLYELAQEGYEVVVGMGPRVNEETIVPALKDSGVMHEGAPLVLAPRDAVKLLLDHLHDDARLMRWTCPFFPRIPYMCVWDVSGGDGILLRCFSLHPYLVNYATSVSRPRPIDASAVDASFIINCLVPWNKIYQVTDSDDFVVLSLTSMHARDFAREPNTDPMGSLTQSSSRHDVTMLHRSYFMNAIKMHASDLDERWKQLERDTLQIAYSILQRSGAPTQSFPLFSEERPEFLITKTNLALAGSDLTGISGKLAARVVWKKVVAKLSGR